MAISNTDANLSRLDSTYSLFSFSAARNCPSHPVLVSIDINIGRVINNWLQFRIAMRFMNRDETSSRNEKIFGQAAVGMTHKLNILGSIPALSTLSSL